MRFNASAEIAITQKPILNRHFVRLVLSLAMLIPVRGATQDGRLGSALTDKEAVRRALSRVALTDLTEGLIGIARSEELRKGIWSDPEIAYEREQTYGSQAADQHFLTLSKSLDLSGRGGLRSTAAGHRVRASTHQANARRLQIQAEVRLRFYELLAAQLRVQSMRVWTKRIEEALEIVTRRESAGDATTYDRKRLERARVNTDARLAVYKADAGHAWARLSGIMGETNHGESCPPPLVGSLLPEPAPAAERLVDALETRPDMLALAAREEAARLDAEAASRWWVPRPMLRGGWTGTDHGSEFDDGYVAGVALAVPLFKRGQDESLEASSAARVARGQRNLMLTEATAEVRGRATELNHLIDAAQRFRQSISGPSGELVRIAEVGYAGNELGILELLDAYRGALDDEMTALDLELTTRRARIELGLLTGGYTK